VEANGFSLSSEGIAEFRAVYEISGERAEKHPQVFARYWQMVHQVMREQADLAAMAVGWSRGTEVGAREVVAALRSHQEIKAGTFLCPWGAAASSEREDREVAAA